VQRCLIFTSAGYERRGSVGDQEAISAIVSGRTIAVHFIIPHFFEKGNNYRSYFFDFVQ
jgi:hypothetical protein